MQAIGGERPQPPLLAHQRKEIDPVGAGAAGFLARDRVEALDPARGRLEVPERAARRSE